MPLEDAMIIIAIKCTVSRPKGSVESVFPAER